MVITLGILKHHYYNFRLHCSNMSALLFLFLSIKCTDVYFSNDAFLEMKTLQ